MAQEKGKKKVHRCPPLPEGYVKYVTPGWDGEAPAQARRKWFKHLGVVGSMTPTPRRTR